VPKPAHTCRLKLERSPSESLFGEEVVIAPLKLRFGQRRCKPPLVFYVARVPVTDPLSSTQPTSALADFLVLGAMKAGTTTLYHDLRTQPDIYLPDKEGNALLDEHPLVTYRQLFDRAAPGQLRGEVCPDYSKPDSDQQAADQAKKLYADREPPKLIYLVREPIARLLSHHYFISTQHGDANPDGMTDDLEKSLRDFPELLDTSRYASRLQPWLDAFGAGQIRIVRFEDYVADRNATVSDLAGFLGLENFSPQNIRQEQVHNASTSRPVATPFWRRIMHNSWYRKCLRPLLSLEMRDRLRHSLLPGPPARPAPPSKEIIARLAGELRPEVAAISEIAGCAKGEMLWDLNERLTREEGEIR